jgi:drug/metabolite transporter (DMT)-like permease
MSPTPKLPSNRKFGWFFAVVFGVAAFMVSKRAHGMAASWGAGALLLAAASLAGLAVCCPERLSRLNRLWFQLGLCLSRVGNPLVLGLLFFGVVTPMGWLGRLAGRDELKLKRRQVASHWVERPPPGPTPESFRNQF